MPVLAYTNKMLEVIQQSHVTDASRRPLFERFVHAIGRQIRPHYHKRNTPSETVAQLAELFERSWIRASNGVLINAETNGQTMVLTTVMPDQPFIVDTLRMQLQARGATNITAFNAIVGVKRGVDGTPIEFGSGPLESIIRMEVEGLSCVPESVVADLHDSLYLSRSMVQDFLKMTDLVEGATFRFSRHADRSPDNGDAYRETGEFLRWLLADNFVFMGIVNGDSRLGFTRPEHTDRWSVNSLDGWECVEGMPVLVRKGRRESPVHRSGRIDEVRVEQPGGEPPLVIQGLFTYRALTQPSRHVPLLRRVLGSILREDESKPGSYRYKGVANVFDSLPTEFLFTATQSQVVTIINQVLEAEQQQETRTQIIQDVDSTFALAAMPRTRWSERLGEQIESTLIEGTGASYTDQGIFVSRYNTMLVHFYLTGTTVLDESGLDELKANILKLSTPWDMQLYETMKAELEPGAASALAVKYGSAFDEVYRLNRPVGESLRDIALLEQLDAEKRLVIADVFTERRDRLYLRIYQRNNILLSHMLPVLDDFGLVIIDQFADPVSLQGGEQRFIDTFRLQSVPGVSDEDVIARGASLAAAIEAVFAGSTGSDALNRLLLQADLPWQAVDMLRAYHGYARQLGFYYSLDRVQDIMLSRPEMVGLLWSYFQIRFDPSLEGDRASQMADAAQAFEDALRNLEAHDQDLVFRTFYNLIQSSIRTNFYRTDRKFHYLSFKVRCADVTNMPSPRMMFEIYVHHRDMEGLHLRGGKVARGGIRWSDRTDFRREILDLVSTQMIKNVLIVPVGAKGGFRMKHRVLDRAESRRRADELYKVLIRGMLDLTDNTVAGELVHPPNVIFHDEPDPYLVVAADKGTAHLSNTANALAAEYGFWLDDAFASGGSNGYDHKEVGITARGGWVTARRHFYELGLDPDREEFTCVGIGDTGGDVFGNGVIETPKMRLVAAFNHLHVFIDPNPDAESSYVERKRLFDAVKGWDHYNTELISEGGGIFSRQARSIPLSPQMQELLGVLKDELPVEVVIRLLLRLNVDLLWNGGIGTYVKASHEDNNDAGDPNNDILRINGNELRARIIGEGGNLGFTQAGRIEYALSGGRVNTDALDNSGGVDMSDHEVNLKILLNPLVAQGKLRLPDRNTLLKRMTDEVADQVLHNSDVHGRQMSLDIIRSQVDPMSFSRTIGWACGRSGRTPAELRLPTHEELSRRAALGKGLTRPELCVLAAHVKMHVFNDLTSGSPDEIPGFERRVISYFPAEIQKDYRERILDHMLKSSIGMTVVANDIIGEAGAWFFPGIIELTGASAPSIARAWINAMALIDAEGLLHSISDSETPLDTQYRAWVEASAAVFSLISLWLAPGEAVPNADQQTQIHAVLERMEHLSGTTQQEQLRERIESLSEVPEALATRIASLGDLTIAHEITQLHKGGNLDETVISYLAIGEASRLLPTIRVLESRRAEGGWDPVAISILRNRYLSQLRSLVNTIELGPEVALGVDRVTLRLSRGHLAGLAGEMESILSNASDIAALLVAEERIRARISREFAADSGVSGTGM
ncbi:MAG: NAD-glutamate dehydrogenase [Myxococcota bacterium]|nr:NAD-glutamate dehydrogenase [Myxococcota bacterium]